MEWRLKEIEMRERSSSIEKIEILDRS